MLFCNPGLGGDGGVGGAGSAAGAVGGGRRMPSPLSRSRRAARWSVRPSGAAGACTFLEARGFLGQLELENANCGDPPG